METLKFVMTAAFYPPYHLGGDANHVRYLAEALAAQGHEVHVEYSPAALALKRGRPDLDDAGDGGVIRHPIKAAPGRFQPLSAWIFGAPPSVRRHHRQLVDEVQPDIIHYHNLSLLGLDLINVPSAALKMYTAHDYWVRCPRNDLFKFNQRLCEKPTCLTCLTISGEPPQLWRYLPSGLTPFGALRAPWWAPGGGTRCDLRAGPRSVASLDLVRERAARRVRSARMGDADPGLRDRGAPRASPWRHVWPDDPADGGRDSRGNRGIRGRGPRARPAEGRPDGL